MKETTEELVKHKLGAHRELIRSDLTGGKPKYLYRDPAGKYVFESESLTRLLEALPTRPSISLKGLALLLRAGVVPQPYTIFEEVFIVTLGWTAEIYSHDDMLSIDFSFSYPFQRAHVKNTLDNELFLELIVKSIQEQKSPAAPSFLFHSAGKDSNIIALALAEAGYQKEVTLLTHKSAGHHDESGVSARIAARLGFQHEILRSIDRPTAELFSSFSSIIGSMPLPCTDNVSLAYPMYLHQNQDLYGANIIDGMGNDAYIGHIPSRREHNLQKLSPIGAKFAMLDHALPTESLVRPFIRKKSEWCGLTGLSSKDVTSLLSFSEELDIFDQSFNTEETPNYFDYRSRIRGCCIDQEIYIRKVRNFADCVGANLVLPWANSGVANYVLNLPPDLLYDAAKLKNKLFLRNLLNEKGVVDSDSLGKKTFGFQSMPIVVNNFSFLADEIWSCRFWNKRGLFCLLERLRRNLRGGGRKAAVSSTAVYRLYLVSAWLNHQ